MTVPVSEACSYHLMLESLFQMGPKRASGLEEHRYHIPDIIPMSQPVKHPSDGVERLLQPLGGG